MYFRSLLRWISH